jgi:uncharacterized protein YvpB
MTEQEIKYAAEQHLSGKPMSMIAAELHYHENTLWRNLRQSNLEYKKRFGVHQVKSFGRTEDYIRGYNPGLKAAWRKQKREEHNV